MITVGVVRFVPHHAQLARLAQGWQWVADLGDVHGEFCTLCWWCCGDCQYGRRTRDTRNMCAFVPSFSTKRGRQ